LEKVFLKAHPFNLAWSYDQAFFIWGLKEVVIPVPCAGSAVESIVMIYVKAQKCSLPALFFQTHTPNFLQKMAVMVL
jgi:hypothetical protein